MLIDKLESTITPTDCGNATTRYYRETSTHDLVPNYHELRRTGQRIPYTNHRHVTTQYSQNTATYGHNQWPIYEYLGAPTSCFGAGPTANLGSNDEALIIATNQAIARLRDKDVDLGIALVELRSTAQLVTFAAVRLAAAAKAVRKGKLTTAGRMLGITQGRSGESLEKLEQRYKSAYGRKIKRGTSTANAWLELQFGVKPLLDDVYGSAKALAKHHSLAHDRTVSVSGRTKREYSERYVQDVALKVTVAGSGIRQAKVGLIAEISDYSEYMQSSLGLNNPAKVFHDAIPLSFVGDWFYPLGNTLDAIGATSGLTFVDGYKRIKSETKQSHAYSTSSNFYGHFIIGSMMYHHSEEVYDRQKLSSFPGWEFPPLRVGDLVPDLWKAVTSIALLKQIAG